MTRFFAALHQDRLNAPFLVTLLTVIAFGGVSVGQTTTIWVETENMTQSFEIENPQVNVRETFLPPEILHNDGKSWGGAIAGACGPGTGDCCTNNGSIGCEDFDCCETVCAIDDWCCTVAWDTDCASLAVTNCDASVCGGNAGCTNAVGDCCTGNGTPGCNNPSCCETVCDIDAFCCETEWDFKCANTAEANCEECESPDCGDAPGDCCQVHPSTGCSDAECCASVCAIDQTCCTIGWSPACVELAMSTCNCIEPAPFGCITDNGDCCTNNFDGSCNDACCCELVCTFDSFCCVDTWDSICGALALDLCPGVCQQNNFCPGIGSCYAATGNSGCNDEYCCNTVCSIDPSCCTEGWDATCVALAQDFCTCLEDTGPTCPVEPDGDCCDGNGTPGCENDACCAAVCEVDNFCCTVLWDGFCAEMAVDLCGCPTCGDGNIFYLNPPDGWVDPGQPFALDTPDEFQGQRIFSATTPGTAGFDGCWSICESLQNGDLHPDLGSIGVAETLLSEANLTRVTLSRAISPGEFVRITYTSGTGSTIATGLFQALPGDVNGDGTTLGDDIRLYLDEFDFPGTLPLIRSDIDRDGEVNPEDLLRLIDLMNGGGPYQAWFGMSIETTEACLAD
ncbi:MAG: hypothetical protein ACPGXK_00300 [Phycisphaerae bacterium]